MNLHTLVAVSIAIAATAAAAAAPQMPAPATTDGLVAVAVKNLDEMYVRPNTELAAYRKVIIDQPTVTFQKGWLKSINGTRDVSRWLTPDDQRRLEENFAAGMRANMTDAFKSRGYEVVTEAGPGVLRLSPSVTELFLNAPDVQSANLTREFSRDTGLATLNLEARDAVSGTLLARIIDHDTARELRNRPVVYTSDVSNVFNMNGLFRQWAESCIKAFGPGPERVGLSG